MFLSIQKCLSVDNIELHVHTLLIKVSTDQCYKFLQALSSCKCRRMEFLIEQCSVGYDKVIQTGYGSCCCCRALHILAC